MARFLGVLLAAASLAVPFAGATVPQSGLFGVVRRGPTSPVCQVGVPCDAPVRVTLVFSRFGRDVAHARSGTDGRYRIVVSPGIYIVRTVEQIGIGKRISPAADRRQRGSRTSALRSILAKIAAGELTAPKRVVARLEGVSSALETLARRGGVRSTPDQ